MRSDLASLFHLLSAISFMKSTWPPCCILIKNSFCAALKKVGALFPILGDDGGTVEGAGAICLLSARFGDRGGFHFSVTLLHCSDDVGVPPGAARASPQRRLYGVYASNPCGPGVRKARGSSSPGWKDRPLLSAQCAERASGWLSRLFQRVY